MKIPDYKTHREELHRKRDAVLRKIKSTYLLGDEDLDFPDTQATSIGKEVHRYITGQEFRERVDDCAAFCSAIASPEDLALTCKNIMALYLRAFRMRELIAQRQTKEHVAADETNRADALCNAYISCLNVESLSKIVNLGFVESDSSKTKGRSALSLQGQLIKNAVGIYSSIGGDKKYARVPPGKIATTGEDMAEKQLQGTLKYTDGVKDFLNREHRRRSGTQSPSTSRIE